MTGWPDLRPHIEEIARRLLGQPNESLSTRDELRFGTHGSVSVKIAGEKAGTWYDHENQIGGGAWLLVKIKGGMENGAAAEWLRSEIGVGIQLPRRPVAYYDYRDEQGELLFQKVRYDPKDFRLRRPNGNGGWIWSMEGVRWVLYRLPELIAAPPEALVSIVEGEKDADNVVKRLGLIATCNAEGAAKRGKDGKPAKPKWRREYNPFFQGQNVLCLPDNDDAGHDHMLAAAAELAPIAAHVRIIELPGLPPKGDVSDWLNAGGTREQLEKFWAEAPDFQPQASSNPYEGERQQGRVITVNPGERHKAADEGITALFDSGIAFFQRDRKLYRVVDLSAKSSNGDTILVPGIAAVTPAILDRALGQAAIWQRQGKNTAIQIDPPNPVAAQIIDMVGEWPFPALAGITGCPTLRPDGSVLSAEGYDPATGLVLKSAVAIPPLPDHPTRGDAEHAVQLLFELLAEFPFANEESKSVALSKLLTPVLRGAMSAAPMHLVTAPQPGTGKSYLADVASMIATGERVAVVAVSPKVEETEKRLVGCALAGYPIIGLDNCRGVLEGDFLCQVTERPLLQLRPLGKSDIIRVPNTFTTFANGNNVGVADDLVRRTINCALDANVEDPETRAFRGDPLAAIRRNRGAYVAACLTIARAYLVAGKPNRLPPLASYEGWSDLVRSPLVWLGRADPVLTMVAARDADPVRQERTRVFDAWSNEIGSHDSHTAPQLIELAVELRYSEEERITRAVRPALHAALLEIAEKRGAPGQIDPVRLGLWLTRNANTIVDNFKLTVDRADTRRVRYGLRKVQKA